MEKEPQKITIIRREPGSNERVTLYPRAGRAELIDSVLLTNGPEPPSQPDLDLVQFNWELIKKTTADKTRHIGDRIISGVPATGFEFEIPGRGYVNPDSKFMRDSGIRKVRYAAAYRDRISGSSGTKHAHGILGHPMECSAG